MPDLERIALELLEYKVEDLRSQRAPRGGGASAWELHEHLERRAQELDPEERRRLEVAGRLLRRFGPAPAGRAASAAPAGPAAFGDLVLGVKDEPVAAELDTGFVLDGDDPPAGRNASEIEIDPAVAEEAALLQRLAQRAWWQDVDGFVQRVAASLRAERERATARLLYATIRNLGRYVRAPTFGSDLNLSRFTVAESIPERDDPLLSLNDLDSLAELVREVIDTVLSIGRREGPYAELDLRGATALEYVRRVAAAVARDPYAGKTSLLRPKGPTSDQLRLALQELAKERMRDDERIEQRRNLERRLQDALAFERNLRSMHQQDVARYGELMEAFFDRLAKYLPRRFGGEASGPRLQGGVLFAVNPALRWDSVPAGATALTVHVKGPVRFGLAGVEIAVAGQPPSMTMYVQGRELPLRPRMGLKLGRRRVLVFHEGRYLHVKVLDEGRALAVRVAEALAVHHVLNHDRHEELLTALKLAANTVVGEGQELVRRAIERAAEVTAKAPDRHEAMERYLQGAARAVHVDLSDHEARALARRFVDAVTIEPTDLARALALAGSETESVVLQLTGDPLSFTLRGLDLTVRAYRGRDRDAPESLVAILPGRPLGSFTDYLIERVGPGSVVLVRGDQELAALFVPDASIDPSRTV